MSTAAEIEHDIDTLLRSYVDDVCEIVEIFDAMDPSGARVSGEYGETVFASGEVNDTERPPPMFSRDEVDTFAPVTRVLGDADELTAPLGRMVPRFDAVAERPSETRICLPVFDPNDDVEPAVGDE